MKRSLCVAIASFLIFAGGFGLAQSAGTGAIAGVVTDQTGAIIPDATIKVTNLATGTTQVINSTSDGHFTAALLQPGTYDLTVSKTGFRDAVYNNEVVDVSETETLNVALAVGSASQTVEVSAASLQLKTQTSSLSSVTSGKMLQSLPLVTRNFVQIIGLSPGVSTEVTNAGELGRGDTQLSLSAAGSSVTDNNFEMNGIQINDLQGSGTFSGGNPIPNPDAIQEFNVQTVPYDASYGHNAGANVNVVTKGGTNQFHGGAFEFFRNTALNANDFFINQVHGPRPVLQQNQFGLTLGGPIVRDKVTFFVAYQGTRQANGFASTCLTSFKEPALTSTNRTAAGLGALFAGQAGYAGTGVGDANVVAADGSNISPQALSILNFKLPNGQYMIPNAQTINANATNPAAAGTVAISVPCSFNEDQYMGNADWNQSSKSTWQERFFFVNSHVLLNFNAPGLGGSTVPGFGTTNPNHFRDFTLSNSYIFTPQFLNQVTIGYNRIEAATQQATPFTWSDVGVNAPEGPFVHDNTLPVMAISGSFQAGGNGQTNINVQNQYSIVDNLSLVKGRHSLRFGGGINLDQIAYDDYKFYGGVLFLGLPDFLLGNHGGPAATGGNGTPFSNIYLNLDVPGIIDRNFDIWNYFGYVQDNIQVTQRFVLNAGFRYERLGGMEEVKGRNANTNFAALNPNPPAAGTLQGLEVAGNYPYTAPPGVTVLPGKLAYSGDGQNTINPRIGFSWQLPGTDRVVLRGGYGIFHQTISGQPTVQLIFEQPWAILRALAQSPTIDFANPFQPAPASFPVFSPYSPTTTNSTTAFAQNIRPPMVQHFSLNTQTLLARNMIFELGYIGSRGEHLILSNDPNQALYASPGNPIRGASTNTVANIGQRVRVQGYGAADYTQIGSSAQSWYNALETSLTKRFDNGLQFLASYTWARALQTGQNVVGDTTAGSLLGDQYNLARNYGPSSFIRPNRFVFSGAYALPGFKGRNALVRRTLGDWTLTGVITLQDGDPLTVTGTNGNNVLGIAGDFAELSGTCRPGQYVNHGSIESNINRYINTSCFTGTYPVVGADGVATGFGNSSPGILRGPGQRNIDAALYKNFGFNLFNKATNVQFRAEAFNLFNTPQFSNPDTGQSDATFGEIQSASVAPRILQFALKLNF
ncbi:MAG: carboxypeptidase regulatory-like domain-containing protein [Acidobacteriaceae bacterium]